MQLRPNQVEPTKLAIEFFNRKNAVPSLIVAPTAFGKSWLIAKVAESCEDKLLVLQPTKELLEQNITKYIALGGTDASIYSASFGQKKIGAVTYATIGSIKKIGTHFKELGFTKLIIDEAHLYPRESDSMLGMFLKESEIAHVLGLTATPLKLQSNMGVDGKPFSKLVMLTNRSKKGNFFKEIIYVSQVKEMVELGFWCKLEYEQYDVDESGLVYNSTKAEFTEESIQRMYAANNTHHNVIRKIEQLQDRNSIIVFVPSVADAQHLAEITPNAVAIYGDMPKKEREQAVSGFKRRSIRVVFNVNVLSVGFDHPELDCIICARSTASLAWYYQALGRGTRIAPTKRDCMIVDFSGNVKRFGKIESLYYKKENMWKLYGENGILLTGCAVHTIGQRTEATEGLQERAKKECIISFGRHTGKTVEQVFKDDKNYLDWMLRDFKWNPSNQHIKQEILRLKAQPEVVNPKGGRSKKLRVSP